MDERIAAALKAALQVEYVHVEDESWRHKGHAGAKEGGHFVVTVVSPQFADKSLVERHRMVYAALENELPSVHALSIQAMLPQEWAQRREL